MGIAQTLGAFVVRDVRTARSYRMNWILSSWGSVSSLFIYFFVNDLVDKPTMEVATGHPVDYFSFVVVGIALYGLLYTGLAVFASSISEEQRIGTLEVLLSMPLSPTLTVFGVVAYGFLWSLASSALTLTVAIAFFGVRLVLDPVAILAALVAFTASLGLFASLGIVVGAYTLVFKRGGPLMTLVTQVLALLGGVYFPVSLMPRPLQLLAEALPLTWALDIMRRTLLAGEVPYLRVAMLILVSGVTIPVAVWIFNRALSYARRAGSLAQF